MAAPAVAADLVVNGGFDVDETGWTLGPGCVASFVVTSNIGYPTGTFNQPGDNFAKGEDDDGVACEFYQQIALPAGTANTLTFAAGAAFAPGAPNPASEVRVRITDATGTTTLVTAFLKTGADLYSAIGPQPSVDLTPYAGQTIRIVASSTSSGPGQGALFVIDDVVLDSVIPAPIPTLTEWAMIVLASLLALGGGVALSRRRLA